VALSALRVLDEEYDASHMPESSPMTHQPRGDENPVAGPDRYPSLLKY